MFLIPPLHRLLLGSALIILPLWVAANRTISLPFYGIEVLIQYDPAMRFNRQLVVEEVALRQAYDRLSHLPYQPLLQDLQQQAEELALNDWLYFELVQKSLSALYEDIHSPEAELTAYFLLAQSGFDVRLTYRNRQAFVNAYTEDNIYEIPLIEEDGRLYANISSVKGVNNTRQSMYLLNHRPNRRGRAFQFTFSQWPEFPQNLRTRTLAFPYAGQLIEMDIQYDGQVAQLMQHYPLIDEYWYLQAPLSASLQTTLLPQFRRLMAGKSQSESLELLVSFTRSAFEYKEDKKNFGGSKPMVPDELFYYPYSDCEDRAALFFSLVKELLGLRMIVIAYEDHLSVAVEAPEVSGDAVEYQGRRYVFCDPTGPSSSSEIGQVPEGYQGARFQIIGSYF